MNKDLLYRIDWITLLIYLLLVLFGMINIYSISYENIELSIFMPLKLIGANVWSITTKILKISSFFFKI